MAGVERSPRIDRVDVERGKRGWEEQEVEVGRESGWWRED